MTNPDDSKAFPLDSAIIGPEPLGAGAIEPPRANPAGSWRADTIAAQAAGAHDRATGGVIPAWQPSTTFLRHPDQSLFDGRVYARGDAPNLAEAERVIAALEGAEAALLYASGMAAATALIRAAGPGARILAQGAGYYKFIAWLQHQDRRGALSARFFDPDRPEALRAAAMTFRPHLIWIETPANPLMQIVDIAACAEIAHACGAELAVDSSLATPILTRPLALGADYVFHSVTKALNGHSDVLGGALAANPSARLWSEASEERNAAGAQLGAFEAWLLLRGMRTLGLRVERANANALKIAQFLRTQPAIAATLYPGLPDHRGHRVAQAQMAGGFGGVLAVRMAARDGRSGRDQALALAGRVRLFQRATSVGGVESLIEHRASVEGAHPVAPDDLLRLSIGIENAQDLIDDLAGALRAKGG